MEAKVKTKQEVHIYVMLALQCMHANLLKKHGFCWVLHAKWYPSVRIDEKIQVKLDLGKRLYGAQGESPSVTYIFIECF